MVNWWESQLNPTQRNAMNGALGALGAGMMGAPNPFAQENRTALEVQMIQQQANLQMAQMQNAMQVQLLYGFNDLRSWNASSCHFDVEGNGPFTARHECKTTHDTFELVSVERAAAERGMRHFVYKWDEAIDYLRRAGLKDDELHVALVHIKPRLITEAHRERDLEEGVRQAESKARELLVMCLNSEQREEFKKSQSFTINVDHKVRGFPTGAFRIRKGSAFNVEHIEGGETFCVVAQEEVPVYDQMLTQKLLLEQEPERFFKTANRSNPYDDLLGIHYEEWRRYPERQLQRRREAPTAIAPQRAPDPDEQNIYRQAMREFTERHR